MRNVIPIRRVDFPQQLDPGTHRQVTQLLEAADEAHAQGRDDLRDSLVGKARQMVEDLRAAWGMAA
jgi:hypothetical protein